MTELPLGVPLTAGNYTITTNNGTELSLTVPLGDEWIITSLYYDGNARLRCAGYTSSLDRGFVYYSPNWKQRMENNQAKVVPTRVKRPCCTYAVMNGCPDGGHEVT